MFEFNIVESTETHERAYYVNGVRFDREIWRACMEAELASLEKAKSFEVCVIAGYDLAIKSAQKHMDGKATFDLPSDARGFYRQVVREIRSQKREAQDALSTCIEMIEDLTEKLED